MQAINLQIGGLVTSMQRSFLGEFSPHSSLSSTERMKDSLITSSDFTNVTNFMDNNFDFASRTYKQKHKHDIEQIEKVPNAKFVAKNSSIDSNSLDRTLQNSTDSIDPLNAMYDKYYKAAHLLIKDTNIRSYENDTTSLLNKENSNRSITLEPSENKRCSVRYTEDHSDSDGTFTFNKSVANIDKTFALPNFVCNLSKPNCYKETDHQISKETVFEGNATI